jgi:threonine aldolase
MGMQFEALFHPEVTQGNSNSEQVLYLELGSHANYMAEKIADTLQQCGYTFNAPVASNQLFPILPNDLIKKLSKDFKFIIYEAVDEKNSVVRLVTSWATPEENVNKFISFIQQIS